MNSEEEVILHRDGCTGALTDQHGNYVEEK